MLRQIQIQSNRLVFTQKHINRLENIWDKRNEDIFSYIPHEKRGQISPEKATFENEQVGEFASNYMKKLLAKATVNQKMDHVLDKKSLLYVGYGKGYDGNFILESYRAGLNTVCLDVSGVACKKAEINFAEQWAKIQKSSIVFPEPKVVKAEIQSALAYPELYDLDITSVKLFYFCRTLTCISTRSAKLVLRSIGELFSEKEDPLKEKRLVIISAFKDDNLSRSGKTSKLYYISDIIKILEASSERKMGVFYKEHHLYFDQRYTALTIKPI